MRNAESLFETYQLYIFQSDESILMPDFTVTAMLLIMRNTPNSRLKRKIFFILVYPTVGSGGTEDKAADNRPLPRDFYDRIGFIRDTFIEIPLRYDKIMKIGIRKGFTAGSG